MQTGQGGRVSLSYYATHGPITDPGAHAEAFTDVPPDMPTLTRVVQGLVYHYVADEPIFGWRPPTERLPEIDTRQVEGMLARPAALDPRPLTEPRPPERRLVGRHVAHYRIGFDPLDVPRDQFLVGGRAWQDCRAGGADPETFGLAPELPQPRGMRFVRGHVVQDLAALNKLELLLWDVWGVMQAEPDAELPLLDEVAARTQAGGGFAELRRLAAIPGLAVPDRIRSLSPVAGPREVAITGQR